MGNWFSCFNSKKPKHFNNSQNADSFDTGVESRSPTDNAHHIERQGKLLGQRSHVLFCISNEFGF